MDRLQIVKASQKAFGKILHFVFCESPNSRPTLHVNILGLSTKVFLRQSTDCSETNGWPECLFLWPEMNPFSMKLLCQFKVKWLLGWSTVISRVKACCMVTTICFNKFQDTHLCCCENGRHLKFHCLLTTHTDFVDVKRNTLNWCIWCNYSVFIFSKYREVFLCSSSTIKGN